MRQAAITLALLSSTFAPAGFAEDTPANSRPVRSIAIQPTKPRFALGEPIEIRISFLTPMDTPWKLEEPESSAGVKVHYEEAGKAKPLRRTFSFSRVTSREVHLPNGETQTVYTAPPTREIEIPAGGKHELTADLYAKWTEDLAPGDYEVWVEDTAQKLTSSRAAFSLVFSKDSVPALLATAASETEIPLKRKWCAAWLKKIQPDFDIKTALANEPPEAATKAAADNARAVQSFKAHWEKVKDTKEIEALFAKPAPRADREPQSKKTPGTKSK